MESGSQKISATSPATSPAVSAGRPLTKPPSTGQRRLLGGVAPPPPSAARAAGAGARGAGCGGGGTLCCRSSPRGGYSWAGRDARGVSKQDELSVGRTSRQ